MVPSIVEGVTSFLVLLLREYRRRHLNENREKYPLLSLRGGRGSYERREMTMDQESGSGLFLPVENKRGLEPVIRSVAHAHIFGLPVTVFEPDGQRGDDLILGVEVYKSVFSAHTGTKILV